MLPFSTGAFAFSVSLHTFLGFAFRARQARNKDGQYFSSFLSAMSPEAFTAKGEHCAPCECTSAPT